MNLLLRCTAEEGLFRGVVQRCLSLNRAAPLFGLAHFVLNLRHFLLFTCRAV